MRQDNGKEELEEIKRKLQENIEKMGPEPDFTTVSPYDGKVSEEQMKSELRSLDTPPTNECELFHKFNESNKEEEFIKRLRKFATSGFNAKSGFKTERFSEGGLVPNPYRDKVLLMSLPGNFPRHLLKYPPTLLKAIHGGILNKKEEKQTDLEALENILNALDGILEMSNWEPRFTVPGSLEKFIGVKGAIITAKKRTTDTIKFIEQKQLEEKHGTNTEEEWTRVEDESIGEQGNSSECTEEIDKGTEEE